MSLSANQSTANIAGGKPSNNSNPVYAPTSVLKRFAVHLEQSTNLETKRFREINIKRVNDFIRKPYAEEPFTRYKIIDESKKQKIPGIFNYAETLGTVRPKSIPLDIPEFQRYMSRS